MARLAGKTALITGGTTGIGLATAALFVDEGAKVLITEQDQVRVQQAVDQLEAAATGICADQTSLSDLATLAAQVEEHFGQLDILFLNAGVTMPAATSNESESHFDTQVAINLKGPFFTLQKLAPLMREGDSIIAWVRKSWWMGDGQHCQLPRGQSRRWLAVPTPIAP